MKRLMAMILVGVLLISLVGCGKRSEPPAMIASPGDGQVAETTKPDEGAVTGTEISKPSEEVTVTPEATETGEENAAVSELPSFEEWIAQGSPEMTDSEEKINFQEKSYVFEDADGYKLQVTVRISPWILQSNSELVNAAWEEVGNPGDVLPTIESFGLSNMVGDNSRYFKRLDSNSIFVCPNSGFDMYFAMGTIRVKNLTEGYDFTESNKRTVDFYFDSELFYDGVGVVNFPAICRAFYSRSAEYGASSSFRSIKLSSATMKSNQWGPLPFVIAHGESFSPKNPEGIYHDVIRDSQIRFSCANIGYYLSLKAEYGPEEEILTFDMDVLEP